MFNATWSKFDQSTFEVMKRYVRPSYVLLDAGVGLGGLFMLS